MKSNTSSSVGFHHVMQSWVISATNCSCYIQCRLDMSAQVSNICRAAYSNVFRIANIWTCLTTAACTILAHSLVTSRLDYGNAVLCEFPTASCTAFKWCSLGGQSCAAAQARWPAKHDGRIATTQLVAYEVPHWIQATRHCVSRSTQSNAGVHRLVNHAVLRVCFPQSAWTNKKTFRRTYYFNIAFIV